MVLLEFAERIVLDPQTLSGNRSLRSALAHLAHADACARSEQCSPWEFAVEIESLITEGLTASDLRWLVRKGYVEHAFEVTRARDAARRFQPCRNLAFSKRTCFVLTEAGAQLADADSPQPPSFPPDRPSGVNRMSGDNIARVSSMPSWDHDRRILRLDNCIIKQFKVPSPSQEAILSAFEEEGWPAAIDDPLPPRSELDQKRRLRNTIQSLNANQKSPLLHFHGDGSGERIVWEMTPDSTEQLVVKGRGSIRAA
jgi:hypothetical protein